MNALVWRVQSGSDFLRTAPKTAPKPSPLTSLKPLSPLSLGFGRWGGILPIRQEKVPRKFAIRLNSQHQKSHTNQRDNVEETTPLPLL